MKNNYLIAIFIILFVVGCSVQEVSEELPKEQEPISEPQENIVIDVPEEIKTKEEPLPKKEEKVENVVFIRDSGLYPQNITIYKGETITWITDVEKISNNQPRIIVCYKEGVRVFFGERLIEKGQKSEFKFKEPGEYLCQEVIFGSTRHRGNIKVKTRTRPAITGAAIGVLTETQFLPLMIVLALIFLGIAYSKKNKK